MGSSRSILSSPKTGVARLATVAILSGCMVLAATTVASASKSGSPWNPILKGLTKSANSSFSAVYQIVETTGKVTTENEAITYAQDPSKKELALITPSGSFYISATKTLACRTQAGHFGVYTVAAEPGGHHDGCQERLCAGQHRKCRWHVTNRGQRSWLHAEGFLAELWHRLRDAVRL